MPVYEYHCNSCQRDFEYQQRMSDPEKEVCEACGGALERVISRTAFALKGGGWYKDLYASNRPEPIKAEGKTDGKSEGGSDGAPSAPAAPAPSTSSAPAPSGSSSGGSSGSAGGSSSGGSSTGGSSGSSSGSSSP